MRGSTPSDINQLSAGGGPRSKSSGPWHRLAPKKIRPERRRAPGCVGAESGDTRNRDPSDSPPDRCPARATRAIPRSNWLPSLAEGWGHGSRIVDLPISACLLELPCQKRVISNNPGTPSRFRSLANWDVMDLGASFMTEEKARHYAKVLSRGMGVTFHAVRSRQGRFLAVQIPSDGCEILATIRPPGGANESQQSRREQVRRATIRCRRRQRAFDSTAAEMRPRGPALP